MDPKEHWENIYKTKSVKEVSWFAEHLDLSLELLSQLKLTPDSAIIDIGGGASTLVDDLLSMGYSDITVLDISEEALKISRERLGERAHKVKWIADNILTAALEKKKYKLWHDRAVFHFLTDEKDRAAYKIKVENSLSSNGYLIISGFADDGPMKCSGLEVKRHNENDFIEFFGKDYKGLIFKRTSHITPAGIEQKFLTAVFQKL